MAILYVRNLPDDLYERLQQLAASQHRSINAQAIAALEQALPPQTQQAKSEHPSPFGSTRPLSPSNPKLVVLCYHCQ